MSDEPEIHLFHRELSSVWVALAAGGLAMSCVVALEFIPPYGSRSFLVPGAIAAVVTSGFGRFVSLYRCLGFAPPLATVAVGLAAWKFAFGPDDFVACLFGLTLGGVLGGSLYHVYRMKELVRPGDDRLRPSVRVIDVLLWAVALQPIAPFVLGLNANVVSQSGPGWQLVPLLYLLSACIILCVWCWLWLTRPFVELVIEPFFRLLYRVMAKGVTQLPPVGPCLVVANHACWFDPCFLGMILPRPITPIMTARFFNLWFLKPLLKHVFRVIVVPETPLKRETPELEQAVAALDRGEVVVIFPEGYLRRKEEVPLRRFGQGVWHILSARPATPVVACWIEGGWGSKFSYKNGPPTKNKPMDFRRRIDIAASAAEPVPAEVLADQMATRIHLMNRVARMRPELGLAPLPEFELPHPSEAEKEA